MRVPGSPPYRGAAGAGRRDRHRAGAQVRAGGRRRRTPRGRNTSRSATLVDGLRVIKDGLERRRPRHRQRPDAGAAGRQGDAAGAGRAPRRGGRPRKPRRSSGRGAMRISHFFIDRPIFASRGLDRVRDPRRGRRSSACRSRSIPRSRRRSSTSPASIPAPAPTWWPRPWSRRSRSRSTASRTCSTCRRTRPPTGASRIAVTFDLGTNLDIAQVQVQNRVAIAQPRLPADVRNIGVTVTKSSPDLMMVVHLYSPDQSRDTLFISNYADARDQGRADPRRRRRLDHRVRQPRLFDADLARSATACSRSA